MTALRNGFVDPVLETMSEPVRPQLPSTKSRQELLDALAQRKLAHDAMRLKGSYGPSLAAMKDTLATPDTAADVQARLDTLSARRHAERHALFDLQADAYLADAVELYLATDDGVDLPEVEALHHVLSTTSSPRHSGPTNAHLAHEYAYCRALVDGVRLRSVLAAHEAEARRRREARFPASVDEYRALGETDGEQGLRVARFLAADKGTKEGMLERYGWAYRQVRPLEEAYAADAAFVSEVQRAVRG